VRHCDCLRYADAVDFDEGVRSENLSPLLERPMPSEIEKNFPKLPRQMSQFVAAPRMQSVRFGSELAEVFREHAGSLVWSACHVSEPHLLCLQRRRPRSCLSAMPKTDEPDAANAACRSQV
jgi:hypothetical protein